MYRASAMVLIVALTAHSLAGCRPSSEPSSPPCTPAPGSDRIAYVSDRDGSRDIYVMNADGTCVTRLTHTRQFESDLAWSPDGTQILFSAEGGFLETTENLYLLNVDSLQTTLLASRGQFNWQAAWSPDGAQIAFLSDRDGFDTVYVMNADGSHQTRLADFAVGWDEKPSWSPDGGQVAFYGEGEGSDVYVANVDGSGVRNLTHNPAETSVRPMWSPDGRYILFESYEAGKSSYRSRVCVMNVDGSNVQCILKGPYYEVWGWGPDEKSVSVKDIASRLLYTVDVDCALERQSGGGDLPPQGCYSSIRLPDWPHGLYLGGWSADGTLFLFQAAESYEDQGRTHYCDDLYVVRVDGTGLVNLTDSKVYDGDPTWSP
jgi:Tol biopolymer transport system component